MKIPYEQWANQIDECLFYYDVQASIDGVMCGETKKSFINQWLKRQGYQINWKTFDLLKIKEIK